MGSPLTSKGPQLFRIWDNLGIPQKKHLGRKEALKKQEVGLTEELSLGKVPAGSLSVHNLTVNIEMSEQNP